MSDNLNEWERQVRYDIWVRVIMSYDSHAGIDIVKSEIFKAMQELYKQFDPDEVIQDEINTILESRNIKERV
jgi:hypothetical protein